ncbi:cytochrome P450 [Whalleya microplaca]|nr:cytochrome P450 [Whalleya microplaca]
MDGKSDVLHDLLFERHWLQQLQQQRYEFSVKQAFCVAAVTVVTWSLWSFIYNLYFHPLAKYPGPFWARASLFWRIWNSLGGRFHRKIQEGHRKYGDVFRVGPSELSFVTPTAAKAIYGQWPVGKPPIVKAGWYEMLGAGFAESCLATEKDPKIAVRKRALFTPTLSNKALCEQEELIQSCAGAWIEKLGKLGSGPDGLDLRKWYNIFSFEIFGKLAFGEPFGCIENENTLQWMDILGDHLFAISLMDNLRRIPIVLAAAKCIPSTWTLSNPYFGIEIWTLTQYSRLSLGEQKDFMSVCVDKVLKGEVSQEEMAAHCRTLLIAGGETTATAMTATTHYLLNSPECLEKLKQEIRERFSSLDEITIASTAKLPYLRAVIKEGLRIFPVGAIGFPRISPGMTVDGCYVPRGTEFYVSYWAETHDERYFHEPYTFKPERWIDPNCKDVKEASLPFSNGPRSCPGKDFAYAQMSLELSVLFLMYDLELVKPGLDWEDACRTHFLWYKPELKVRLHRRRI